jgi:hypothetical protein|tara:strand:- start:1548 stop:1733 length:186 start_codon:yes stop_codon:yes gene_type:complete
LDFFSLGIIGTAEALGSGTPLISALICGSIPGSFSAFGSQCPAELDSVVSQTAQADAQRDG